MKVCLNTPLCFNTVEDRTMSFYEGTKFAMDIEEILKKTGKMWVGTIELDEGPSMEFKEI